MASVLQCFVCGYPIVVPCPKPSIKVEKGKVVDSRFPCSRCHSTYELSMILMYRPENIPDAALNLPTK